MHYTYVHLGFSLPANITYICAVNVDVRVACWEFAHAHVRNFADYAQNYAYTFYLLLCLKLCWHNVRVSNGHQWYSHVRSLQYHAHCTRDILLTQKWQIVIFCREVSCWLDAEAEDEYFCPTSVCKFICLVHLGNYVLSISRSSSEWGWLFNNSFGLLDGSYNCTAKIGWSFRAISWQSWSMSSPRFSVRVSIDLHTTLYSHCDNVQLRCGWPITWFWANKQVDE